MFPAVLCYLFIYYLVMVTDGALMLDTSKSSVSDEDKTEFLRVHNEFRRGVSPSASNMKKMSWNDQLARMAQSWADGCYWGHGQPSSLTSSYDQVGQNLWLHTGGFSATESTTNWYDEVSDYTYSSSSCSNVCGHYTQVVWADSDALGCGINYCSGGVTNSLISGPSYYIVCNYGPAGNWVGQKPYIQGPSCSQCEDRCQDRLCTDEDEVGGGSVENGSTLPTLSIVSVMSMVTICMTVIYLYQLHLPST